MVNARDHAASEKSRDFPRISNCAVYLRLWCQHCDVACSADVLGSAIAQLRHETDFHGARTIGTPVLQPVCRPARAPKPNCDGKRAAGVSRCIFWPSHEAIGMRNLWKERRVRVVPSRCTKVRIVCGRTSDPRRASGRCTKNNAWPWYSTFSAWRRLLLA